MLKLRNTLTLLAAMVAIILVAPSAFAQDRAIDRQDQDRFGHMMSAIDRTAFHTDQLTARQDLTADRIHFYDANQIARDDNARVLDETLERHRNDTQMLHEAINRHQVLRGALTQREIATDDVIGIDVRDNGDVHVYHRPRLE